MKALCIQTICYDLISKRYITPILLKGDVVTIIHEQEDREGIFYAFAETGLEIGFHSKYFVKLPDVEYLEEAEETQLNHQL
jgi:hypothetical protein